MCYLLNILTPADFNQLQSAVVVASLCARGYGMNYALKNIHMLCDVVSTLASLEAGRQRLASAG